MILYIEGTLTTRHPLINYFSREHLREQLLEKLKLFSRSSEAWNEAKYKPYLVKYFFNRIRGDPYSELDEKYFHKYSALKV